MHEQIPLTKHFRFFKRGIKFLNELSKFAIILQFFRALLTALVPYVTIYMSALILTELVTLKRMDTLILYVAITIGGTLFLVILKQFTDYFYEKERKRIETGHQFMLNEKAFSLDYAMVEKKETNELRQFVETAARSSGSGLLGLLGYFFAFMTNMISIVIAIIMSAKMFQVTKIAPTDMSFAFVNTYWFSAIFIILLIIMLGVILYIQIGVNQKQLSFFMNNTKFNLLFDFYKETYLDENKAAKDIRIFHQKPFIIREMHDNALLPLFRLMKKMLHSEGNANMLNVAVTSIFGGLVYIFVAFKAYGGGVGIGDVIKYYGAITQLIGAFSGLAYAIITAFNNNEYLKKLFAYLDLPSNMRKGNKILNETEKKNDIILNNVYFRYHEDLPFVLKNINLHIEYGKRLAVVGMNGSGKTSLIKLLCRFYELTKGEISIGQININEIDMLQYQQMFSVVFQDFKLFALPLGQNVAGATKYPEDKVWDVIRLAGLYDRVETFPKKLEHTLYKDYEEDGIDISGGEEQKIAIARALFKDAPFVILDEPTAALDSFSEAEIYEKFDRIIGDKTAIFISHRLSSCKFCDKIVVFDKGEIVQQGTHNELLLDLNGKYYALWNAQAQYYNDKVR